MFEAGNYCACMLPPLKITNRRIFLPPAEIYSIIVTYSRFPDALHLVRFFLDKAITLPFVEAPRAVPHLSIF
jgi:hypothetical protein